MSDDGVGDGDGDADADTGGRSLRYHVDGDLVPAESASVPVTDRGFLYGDAAFETLRAYGGEVFHWDAHADRLAETCDALGMDHGLSDDDLRARIDETLAANDLDEAYVRLSVTRGSQGGRLTPAEAVDPRVVVIVEPLSRGGRGSDPVWDGPATVQTVKTRRIPDRSLPARAKTHNYLNGILARVELRVTGADEALMLDADGYVTEGATSNLFFVDDNALCTPSLDGPVLPGITRRVVLDLARQEGIPIRERRFTPDDVRDANEAFLTNSTWELRPVETVDGIEVGDGPVTKLLSRLYDDYVERRHYGGDGGSDDADNGGDADSVGGDEN
ncbi:aminotransferase class IV [Haloferax volcanii]|uniref:Aminodeoxychorismate lyase n=3 Tax=Haloferax volcanii TaxID=2246 RepID=A0A384L9M8_HALVD|nr:aminotransferase class IV [Haloferax volcanii]ADE04873.1 aminodeoxychorismate lyase [Haloferax volcanii DS2]ELY26428.1 aminodeoxychorismate lyase [Haloferax volcanii DS2]MBS8119742.1 aminotransferase class IV family protein [Haloferax volcanii]MBS8124754.1 aminotransferase class IV family protein [Haloferax volcanii]MBS8128817.1 aminotransferase class IV family protein [Haloferax volcanii]